MDLSMLFSPMICFYCVSCFMLIKPKMSHCYVQVNCNTWNYLSSLIPDAYIFSETETLFGNGKKLFLASFH